MLEFKPINSGVVELPNAGNKVLFLNTNGIYYTKDENNVLEVVGKGIDSIVKINTTGTVDTYRITFTGGSFFDYTITNGVINTINGKTGTTVTLTPADIGAEAAGVYKTVQNTYTKAQVVQQVTLSPAPVIGIDASLSNNFVVTLNQNAQLANPTNLIAGGNYKVVVKQDATGNRLLGFGDLYRFPNAESATISTSAGATDLLDLYYDGSAVLARLIKQYVQQLLLNLYPGAAAAFSTRKLKGDYTGAPLRARRSTDNIEVDIPFAVNNELDESFLTSFVGGFGTNRLLYTEDFDNAYWSKTGVTISANVTVSPIGTMTADKLAETATTGSHLTDVATALPVTAGLTYTRSVYLKASDRVWAVLDFFDNGSSNNTWFNLQTGTLGTVAPGITASIVDVSGGWYRCSVSKQVVGTSVFIATSPSLSNNTTSYTGVAGSGIFIWGAQFQTGSVATTYDYRQAAGNASAFVTTWYDQSGNARHASQSTATSQPRIANAGVIDKRNNKPTVFWDGGDSMFFNAIATTQVLSVFAVQFVQTNLNSTLLGSVSDGGVQIRYNAGQAQILRQGQAGVAVAPAVTTNGLYHNSYFTTASGSSIYGNNALKVSAGAPGFTAGFSVLGQKNTATAEFANDGISEVIIFTTEQIANRSAIDTNMMAFYGITQ